MTSRVTKSRPSQILVIDLIRFTCALAVMAFHYCAAFPVVPDAPFAIVAPAPILPTGLRSVAAYGWVGVEIFFVVSGYVIAMSGDGVAPARFVRRRVLRLVPAAWTCATLTAAVLILAHGYPPETIEARWLGALVFAPLRHPLDPSYWTLFAEVCFYTLVASMLAIRGGGRGVWWATMLLGLACTLYWVATLATAREAGVLGVVPNVVRYGAFFALGTLAQAIRRGDAPAGTAALAVLFAITGAVEIAASAYATAQSLQIAASPVVPIAAFAAACIAILSADRLQPLLARTIGAGRLGLLGLMTYPLYLLHQSIGAVVIAVTIRASVPAYPATLACAIAMIALAWGVTCHVEPPLRRAMSGAIDRVVRQYRLARLV